MSAARWLFLGGFTIVLVSIVVFAIAAYRNLALSTGPGGRGSQLTKRLARLRRDRAEQATWAFLAHRVSGAAIFVFLALHIVDVGLYTFGAEVYDDVHGLFSTLPLRVFECGLLFGILFHTFNGLRLIVVDLTDAGPRAVARALDGVVIATLLLGIAGSIVILAPSLS